MLKKNLLKLSVSLLFLATSCQTLPPDEPIFVETVIGREAQGVHIVSGKTFTVNDTEKHNGKTWWEMKPEMIQMTAQSWKKIKVYIITSCKKYGNCQDFISSWDRTLENIDKTVDNKPR
jgi:hypothetical protein